MTRKSRVHAVFAARRRAGVLMCGLKLGVLLAAAVITPSAHAQGMNAVPPHERSLELRMPWPSGKVAWIEPAEVYAIPGIERSSMVTWFARGLTVQPEVMEAVASLDRAERLAFFARARADGAQRAPLFSNVSRLDMELAFLTHATSAECYAYLSARGPDAELDKLKALIAFIERAGPAGAMVELHWQQYQNQVILAHVRKVPLNVSTEAEVLAAMIFTVMGMAPDVYARYDTLLREFSERGVAEMEPARYCELRKLVLTELKENGLKSQIVILTRPVVE